MKKEYTGNDVTIVICAYKECEYLEECIQSVVNQTVKTNVVISTSTPNEFIQTLADKYGLSMWINKDGGHAKDYNFAINMTPTDICIMAHQDDLIHPDFVKESLRSINAARDPVIAFTNYKEMHDRVLDTKDSTMVKLKSMLVFPMIFKFWRGTRLGKRCCLSFGDPITHPSVTYIKAKMPRDCFREQYISAMDWDLFQRLSKEKGDFVYVDKVLFYHRMHQGTATAKLIGETNNRYLEDLEILCRFWPKPIAKLIMWPYSKAQRYY